VHFRFIYAASVFLILLTASVLVPAQAPVTQEPAHKKEKKADPKPKPTPGISVKEAAKNPTAEMIAETTIFVYGLGGGRLVLDQIRKTALERGRTSVLNGEGRMEQAAYQKWVTRGESLKKQRIRLDQEFPTARYSLIYSDDKTFGIFNEAVFTPRDDAARAFQNQIIYGLDFLLRYKENESQLSLAGKEKIAGVDFHLLDVTDKQSRKARFFVSAKTYRVMMLEYTDEGKKYTRKYYDYNSAQGTLVPFRTVLYQGDKVIEETNVGTVTFGQKIDDAMYSAN
jgi:outer membrane lipoprotein-sorting protein